MKKPYTIANYIDSMFTHPDLYATTPPQLEACLLTAIECWHLTQPGHDLGKVTKMWRKECRARSKRPADVAQLADGGKQVVLDGMQKIWSELRHPLEQLAESAE